MKWLVFLLVLANLLFFAFAEGYFGKPHNPDAARLQKQIKPENIRVVSRDVPPPGPIAPVKADGETQTAPTPSQPASSIPPEAASAKPAGETPAAKGEEVCVSWSGLSVKDADRLAEMLNEKFGDFKQSRRAEKVSGKSWWVFIPPLPSKADADKKIGELKQLGVKEYLIVQDSPQNRLAISLGVFATEAAAKARLGELRDKGVKSAKAEPYGSKDVVAIEARGPAARQSALAEMTKSIPSLKLDAKACQ